MFVTAALTLSVVMPVLDAEIASSGIQLPQWSRTTTATARATLSALSGAMVAVTGTVFSITIVTLSLTSQQFGPRLLRRFMYDLPTQVTLGVFLSTGFYCLLVLRIVEYRPGSTDVPHLSVLLGVAMAVVSMSILIAFIHHVATLIQAPHVVAAVSRDLDDAIVRLFPDKIGEPPADEECDLTDQELNLAKSLAVLRSTKNGYIQAVDCEGLVCVARDADVTIRLRSRAGDFIAVGSPMADVYSVDGREGDAVDSEDLAQSLNEAIIVGVRRTPRQDVECAIEELVEVAVRSLSPGINDPFTAMNCIDRLGASLGGMAERKLPPAYCYGEGDRLRVVARGTSFADVLDAAFNQIRQNGRESVPVTIRLLEALESIAEHVRRDEDGEAILKHASLISRHAESFPEEHDRKGIWERYERVKKSLGE